MSIWEAPLARLRIFNLTVILNDSTTEVPAPDRLKIGQDIVVIVASEMGTLPLYQSQYSPSELLPNGYDQ